MPNFFSFPLILFLSFLNIAAANAGTLDESFELLSSSNFSEKSKGIEKLANSGHAQSEKLLNTILESRLYYVKKDQRFVIVKNEGNKFQLFDALSGEDLGLSSKRKVKKISINNKLRKQIKTQLTLYKLNHADAGIRLAAVESLLGNAGPAALKILKDRKNTETDADVITAIDALIAFGTLQSGSVEKKLAAIEQLQNYLNPIVLVELKKISASADDNKVRAAAKKAVSRLEAKVTAFGHLETLFFGLSLGSILALASIGLAITFGVMGVINMAHGELIMIGAYTTYVVQLLMPNHIEASILVAIPAAFLVSGLVGVFIERFVIRFLYGRPLETLLATFGISLFLQQAIRSIFSPLNRSVITPEWMSGSLQINSLLSITYNRLYIFLFCLIIFALLYLLMKKSSLGLQVRAISQNRAMARAMGIRSQRVDAMTFGLGSGIAGVAGVALSQITNVGPNLGQAYIVDSFMVVVFGGVGNLWGTLISGLTLGVVGKYLEPVTGAVLAKILVLIFIILFINKRPRGLFPQRGRAAE